MRHNFITSSGRSRSLHGFGKDKRVYGPGARVPDPQMDWDALRIAKCRCQANCGEFDVLEGGCSLGLLPSMTCPRFDYVDRSQKITVVDRDVLEVMSLPVLESLTKRLGG
jgi:hypothetical protein